MVMENKKKYIEPCIFIIEIEKDEIICTSGVTPSFDYPNSFGNSGEEGYTILGR